MEGWDVPVERTLMLYQRCIKSCLSIHLLGWGWILTVIDVPVKSNLKRMAPLPLRQTEMGRTVRKGCRSDGRRRVRSICTRWVTRGLGVGDWERYNSSHFHRM